MSTRNMKLLYLVLAVILVMACAPTIATPFPTADPNAVNTFIAQTANVASSQTAAAQPTSTFTPSPTPTRLTDTPSPTTTSTVIFILSTPTPLVIPTFTFISTGGGGSSTANYACQIISVSPANGTSMDEETDFDTTWRVKNIGQKNWDRNSVDFVYDSGAKIHKRPGYDLSANVKTGDTTDLGVDMVAPDDNGTYTTSWELRVGDTDFCKMSLTIVVK